MDILEKLSNCGVVPVVVLDRSEDAVPTAKALLAGGVNIMEITFRTSAAPDAIQAVVEQCPEITVGAATVITLEQCKRAVECGAKFIVTPGYSEEVVSWCIDSGVAITPGCVTPTEIMAAMAHGLKVLKFFPANVYGGLTAIKALAGPFNGIKFIPTGGINVHNIGEYITSQYVHAVGGSWLCPKEDINAGNFENISSLCADSRRALLGYEVAHIGINTDVPATAIELATKFDKVFNFTTKDGNSSVFASSNLEIMKTPSLGERGHLAVRTNCINIALTDLEAKGYAVNMKTAKYNGTKMIAVYLQDEIGGFAIHLLQR